MSEQLQSIAQNNYILHNIDAKKLYVQEPLFTANSGDAVYVGWRPDETVLFTGTGDTKLSTLTLSEPISAFDRVRFRVRVDTISTPVDIEIPMSDMMPTNLVMNFACHYNGWKNIIWEHQYNSTNSKDFNYVSGSYIGRNTSNNITGGDWNNGICFYKVVGINRKENA